MQTVFRRIPLSLFRIEGICVRNQETERTDVTAMFWTCIREVLGSNLGRYTGYPDVEFRSLSLQANSEVLLRLVHGRFLPSPFRFIILFIILSFGFMQSSYWHCHEISSRTQELLIQRQNFMVHYWFAVKFRLARYFYINEVFCLSASTLTRESTGSSETLVNM
jgi:hypothetical protein